MQKNGYVSNSYSVQIENLVRILIRMKLYASKILNLASMCIENYDENLDIKIREADDKIKKASIELEDSVNKIIALSHPVAFDLRFLLSSIKLSSELIYVSSWTKKTISATQRMGSVNFPIEAKKDIIHMIQISFTTLKDVVSTLLSFDSKKKVDNEILFKLDILLEKDDIVDEIYRKILQDGLQSIKQNSSDAIIIFEIIGIAKNLEKVSDCIHNMIVTTRYVLTGKRT
jgi:phosphate transport system protein